MKHVNIALFVPHSGCPHCCSFCNQKTISGSTEPLKPEDVLGAAEISYKNLGEESKNAQIAFFGGSFTAIERGYMISLLEAAKEAIDKGFAGSVRVSTRPDAVDEEILSLLKKYGVRAVELGAQSMDNEVLRLNGRGHTSEQAEKACRMIKEAGIEAGMQMMTGLYGDTDEKCIESARRIIALNPDTVRIYPTIVLEGTELARLLKSGEYEPQSLERAVSLCSKLLMMFDEANIPVIRLGLHSGGSVEEGYLAGPYHPAFKELCRNEMYFKKAIEATRGEAGNWIFHVPCGAVSQMTGQKRANIIKLAQMGINCKIIDDEIASGCYIRAEKTAEED